MDSQSTATTNINDAFQFVMEQRLTKVETHYTNMKDDIKDIKRTLRWLTGIIFGLNSSIIGALAKGFGII